MRVVIRFFFRTLRLILTPFMLLSEKLTTKKPVERSPEEQKAVDTACKRLALYQFNACPFCIKVRKEIARLRLTIETRDAKNDNEHRQELEQGGGRIKVPCLLIEHDDGEPEWLYESKDINAWLRTHFEPKPAV